MGFCRRGDFARDEGTGFLLLNFGVRSIFMVDEFRRCGEIDLTGHDDGRFGNLGWRRFLYFLHSTIYICRSLVEVLPELGKSRAFG